MKDNKTFKIKMIEMATILKEELTDIHFQVYWRELEPYSDKDFDKAVTVVFATCRFFPKPADIIDIIQDLPVEYYECQCCFMQFTEKVLKTKDDLCPVCNKKTEFKKLK